jgi:hypothetical protein
MRTVRLVVATLFVVAVARAEVIVIASGGSAGSQALASALQAADAGDVLLLGPGDYSLGGEPFIIRTGITLLPAPDAGRVTLQFVEIEDVPLGQTVVLRGFDIGDAGWLGGPAAVSIRDSSGTVWIEECNLVGSTGSPIYFPLPFSGGANEAADLFESNVVFRGSTLVGGHGAPGGVDGSFATNGGPALALSSSNAAIYDSTLTGGGAGNGTAGSFFTVGGGDALSMYLSDATVSGCTLTGGAEGADNDATPGASGSAIESGSAFNDVRVVQSSLAAGPVQGVGTQGPVIIDEAGKVALLSEPARQLVLPDQLREGELGTLLLDGEPGDLAMVLISAQAQLIPLKGQEGSLLTALATLQGPLVIAVLAGPDGELLLPFTLPDLPAGLEAVTVYVQGLFKDAGGTSLGGASALTWIDAAL